MSKYKDYGYELGLKQAATLKAMEQYFPKKEVPTVFQQVTKGENLDKLRIRNYGT
jgi:hypothetical protein